MAVWTLNSLPLGYRFRPTDEELVDYYLRNKINGNDDTVKVIREIDVCKCEPWDLPDLSVVQSTDLEWFFFCPRDQKYPNGPRLNRATRAGYWKATGKDRKIKNRVNELGMKKTLVFYKGRAPKGKRTNWVMHEYRPTLAELDGTHPGQNAFVLCRLFKKLDESVENSLCDEVEPALPSPTAINSSPGYTQSELALEQENLALGSQVAKQPTNSESCQAEDFERSSANVLVPLECHNVSDNAYGVDDHAAARTVTEVDPPQVEYGDWMSDPNLNPEDCKLFSPLSAQMRAELGSDMHYLPPNDFSNGHSGLQFQYGTNEHDAQISEFLNSILNDSEDDYYYEEPDMQKTLPAENETAKYINCISHYNGPVKDSGSCSESDQEMAQAQCEPSCCLVEREAPIKIESTPGALRSQTFDNSFDVNFIDRRFLVADCFELQGGFTSPEETNSHVNYIGAGNSATGIRIRTRQPEDYSTSTNFVLPQGIAHRRVRMQTKLEIGTLQYCKTDLGFVAEDDKEKSTVTEEEKPAENHDSDAASATTTDDEPQKLTPFESDEVIMPKMMTMRSTWIDDNNPSVFAKTGVPRSNLSLMSMLRRVGMVIVFCIGLAGLWTSLKCIKIA